MQLIYSNQIPILGNLTGSLGFLKPRGCLKIWIARCEVQTLSKIGEDPDFN